MAENYLFKMMEFVYDAGQIAFRYVNDPHAELKKDDSVLTQADKEISLLAREKLEPFLKTKNHALIDEEDPGKDQYLDEKRMQEIPYLWAVDPIDGTRLYANQIPLFGISLGLLKERKPFLGVVYFPVLKELFYCDGTDAFFIRNAFSNKENRQRLSVMDQEITSKSLFLLSDNFFKEFNWDYENCRLFISACAVVNLCWPTLGRGCGSFDRSHLWDFAGSWPIFQKAGLDLRNYTTGEKLQEVKTDLFLKGENVWRLKDYYILSSQKNFDLLKSKISPNGG